MWRIASVFWLLVGLGVNDAQFSSRRRWSVTTDTADVEEAATDAYVFIILIDPNGRETPPLMLDNFFWNDFRQNSIDTFEVEVDVNMREVCAIRIFHDNSGDSPGWYVNWVKVSTSRFMKTRRVFHINRWVPTLQEESQSHYVVQRTPPCSAGRLP